MTKLLSVKNRRDFLAAAQGRKFITEHLILQMAIRKPDHPEPKEMSRIGYTVTKKIGNAVVRNRVKRRLREAARKIFFAHAKPGCDYILIARAKAAECDFAKLTRDMEFAFSRIAGKKGGEKTTS